MYCRLSLLPVLLISIAGFAQAQPTTAPALSWQQVYGGGGADVPVAMQAVGEDLWLLAGTYSTERSEPLGSRDFWLLRIQGPGFQVSEQSFGGDSLDSPEDLHAAGNRVLLGGTTFSGPGGTKRSGHSGQGDFWLLLLEGGTQLLWESTHGGAEAEALRFARLLEDGGVIAGGISRSPPGGGKQSPHYGEEDFWVLRLSSAGEVLWERSYGGPGSDQLLCVLPLAGGGMLLGGSSDSPPGGGKTAPQQGGVDFWLVCINAEGDVLWDRSYGGSGFDRLQSIAPAPGGFWLGGYSDSPEGGDRSAPGWGGLDYWILRVDAMGGLLKDVAFGGSEADVLLKLQPTPEGGLLAAGYSYSMPGPAKTAPAHGRSDLWVVRVSGQGDRLWEMALGGGGEEYAVCTAFARDGSLLLAGLSGSEPGGNKTPPLLGDVDAWMIALEPEAPWLDADSAAEGRVTLRLYPGALEAWHAVEASTGFIAWEETARFWAELPRYELTFPAPQSPSFYRLKRLSPGEASRK